MKVLIIGPHPEKSKGGMATVIKGIRDDKKINEQCEIDIYPSYIDGNKFTVLIYSFFAYLKFAMTKRGYDIYHIHVASYGSVFRKRWYANKARKWGKKVILHIHGAKFMEFYNHLSDRKKLKVKNLLRSANMVIALSQSWKEKFDKEFELNNCVILENGIDIDKFSRAITDIRINQCNFLMLGRLGQRKGTYDLIEAIDIAKKSVPNIKCYFAGDGEVDKVTKVIQDKRLENNIEVVGWADDSKKVDLLSMVSTLVLPSYNEGLPMAILEGMACGKVIISTNVGAIPEVVTPKNGFLTDPGDIDALANAMIVCCRDFKSCNDIKSNNIARVSSEFSVNAMHTKLIGYYRDLL